MADGVTLNTVDPKAYADGKVVEIPNLINGRQYLFTYHQMGRSVSTTGTVAQSNPVIPHGPPAKPVISRGPGGVVSGSGYFNGFKLNIDFKDKDHSRPNEPQDLIEHLYISYARVQNAEFSVSDAELVLTTIIISDAEELHDIRTAKRYTFADDLLLAEQTYSFSVQSESDELVSPQSDAIEEEMSVLPTAITSVVLSADPNKAHHIKYVLTVPTVAIANEDYYKVYQETINELDVNLMTPLEQGSARVLLKTILHTDMLSDGTFTGYFTAKSGTIARLVVVPFSKLNVMGDEKESLAKMSQEIRNHMLEIGMKSNTVLDGSGNITLYFKASHTASEVGFQRRYIDLSKLSNDEFDIYTRRPTSDELWLNNVNFNLTEKLVLDSEGYAETTFYIQAFNQASAYAENTFSLDEEGYMGEWSDLAKQLLGPDFVQNVDLLPYGEDSKALLFDVTPVVPDIPVMTPVATPTSIHVSWHSAPDNNQKPTSYVVGLAKNQALDYSINSVSNVQHVIVNGDEHFEFTGLAGADEHGKLNTYSVYLYSKNSAGPSQPARSDMIYLPNDALPTNYIENFSVEALEMVDQSLIMRKIKGTITINKTLGKSGLDELRMRSEDEFGNDTGDLAEVTNAQLKRVGTSSNVYTFETSVEGNKMYYLSIQASTLAVASNLPKGIVAIDAKESIKLYTSIDLSLPPRITSVEFHLDTSYKNTLYEITINSGGAPLQSVKLVAIPRNDAVNMIASSPFPSIVFDATKVLTSPNGEHLYKCVVPYLVTVTEGANATINGADLVIAVNRIGQAFGGTLLGALEGAVKSEQRQLPS